MSILKVEELKASYCLEYKSKQIYFVFAKVQKNSHLVMDHTIIKKKREIHEKFR